MTVPGETVLKIPKSRFKTSNGQILTKALFFEETLQADRHLAVYSLKDQDHEAQGIIYPSLYRLYMETNDPTEYRFAKDHLLGWSHWELLQGSPCLRELVPKWRDELSLRLKSESLARIMGEARSRTKESFNANKYLLEKGWEGVGKRGRPSKEAIKSEAQELLRHSSRISEDFSRLGFKN